MATASFYGSRASAPAARSGTEIRTAELTFPADLLPATADLLRSAVQLSFANSVTTISAYGAGMMVLGFLITLTLPEILLRSSNREPIAGGHEW